jgi:hypothetical protein
MKHLHSSAESTTRTPITRALAFVLIVGLLAAGIVARASVVRGPASCKASSTE